MFSKDQTGKIIRDLEKSDLRRTKAGIRHALRHETIRNLAAQPRLLSVAHDILGHEAIPFRATLFDKSPQANWLVVWHQDTALPLRQRRAAPGWGPWSVKDGLRMRMHQQTPFPKWSLFAFISMTLTQKTGR